MFKAVFEAVSWMRPRLVPLNPSSYCNKKTLSALCVQKHIHWYIYIYICEYIGAYDLKTMKWFDMLFSQALWSFLDKLMFFSYLVDMSIGFCMFW